MKSLQYETSLMEPDVFAGKEASQSFMYPFLAVHIFTCAAGDMAVNVVESGSGVT